MYYNPDTMNEIANILDDFDLDILRDMFASQIEDNDLFTSILQDHFSPIHDSYVKAMNVGIENADPEDIEVLRERYQSICNMIINMICNKYGLTFDYEWMNSRTEKLSEVSKAMYQFFVIDVFYVILSILNNYILNNTKELYNAFKDFTSGKDVSTITNMKTITPEYAVIVSNMFDVTDYSFTMMDIDSFFENITGEYQYANVIKELIDQNVLSGDFVRSFADIYKTNLSLRSKIAMELIFRIKDVGYLVPNPIIIDPDDIPEKTTTPVEESAMESDHGLDTESEI